MEKTKYDVFISYRRVGGKNYARTLKPELEKRGFRVFLDFDELKDGVFDKRIMDAISEAPIFLVILSKGALDRCANDGDWVREEILYADKTNRHIVPVEVDKTFREFPENLPNEVKSVLGPHQFSQIDTETLLQESIDKMVRERITPWVIKESKNTQVKETGSIDGAEIHIEVDADCELYRFKKLVKSLSANDDNIVYLKPGKHKLEFVSHKFLDVKESKIVEIPYENYSDLITISLLPQIQRKLAEESMRKAEEEAKRKADEITRNKQLSQLVADLLIQKEKESQLKAEELYQKGMARYEKGNKSQAYTLFLEAAEYGNVKAQNSLGVMYYEGYGVKRDYAEAIKWYRKAIDHGVVKAICNLGIMYEEGKGVKKDYSEAVKLYRKAAEQGNANAQNRLGVMYEEGKGVTKDYTEAIKWYRKASEQGDANAKENLKHLEESEVEKQKTKAQEFFDSKKYGKAFPLYLKIAKTGDVYSQKIIGWMYDTGLGAHKDKVEAKRWYRKAAEQGDPTAQSNLGVMYEKDYDYSEAVKLYREAAEQGNADAQNRLGIMYEKGKGVTKDYTEAIKWYRKASEQGDANAKENLKHLEESEVEEQKTKAQAFYDSKQYGKAFPLYLKIAKRGDAYSQKIIGWMYDTGQGVHKDKVEAKRWYIKAAEQGDAIAQNNLGVMSEKSQDYAEAIKWYRRAAEQGFAEAQKNLAAMYYYCRGVNKDYTEAAKWYGKAADQGDAYSQYSLGYMLEHGQGVAQDNLEAVKWYRKAAEQGNELAKQSLETINSELTTPTLHVIKSDEFYGFADRNGHLAFLPLWTKANEFIDGVALVWIGKRMGAIDEKGKYYFPCIIKGEEGRVVGNGLIKVKDGSLYQLFNLRGENVEHELYVEIADKFINGVLPAVKYRVFGKNKKGYIDFKGKFHED